MDLLVEKMHYTIFNAINKSEIILARKWFCTLDKLDLATLMHFSFCFGFNSNSRLTDPFKRKSGVRKKSVGRI
jgi:hypothetical protein